MQQFPSSIDEHVLRNMAILVKAAVDALKANGWTDEQIAPHARYLADEAVKFLKSKAAR